VAASPTPRAIDMSDFIETSSAGLRWRPIWTRDGR